MAQPLTKPIDKVQPGGTVRGGFAKPLSCEGLRQRIVGWPLSADFSRTASGAAPQCFCD